MIKYGGDSIDQSINSVYFPQPPHGLGRPTAGVNIGKNLPYYFAQLAAYLIVSVIVIITGNQSHIPRKIFDVRLLSASSKVFFGSRILGLLVADVLSDGRMLLERGAVIDNPYRWQGCTFLCNSKRI